MKRFFFLSVSLTVFLAAVIFSSLPARANGAPLVLMRPVAGGRCMLHVDSATYAPLIFLDLDLSAVAPANITPASTTPSATWAYEIYDDGAVYHVLFSQGKDASNVSGSSDILSIPAPTAAAPVLIRVLQAIVMPNPRSVAVPPIQSLVFNSSCTLVGTHDAGDSSRSGGRSPRRVGQSGPGTPTTTGVATTNLGGGGGGGSGRISNVTIRPPVVAPTTTGPLEKCFPDITDKQAEYICFLKERGIVKGYSDGDYKPRRNIQRDEYTKMVMLSLFSEAEINETYGKQYPRPSSVQAIRYPDVPQNHWAAPFIEVSSLIGSTRGYPDGLFRMISNINVAEAGQVALEAFRPDLPVLARFLDPSITHGAADAWYAKYIAFMEQALDAASQEMFDLPLGIAQKEPGSLVNRDEFAQLMAVLIKKAEEAAGQ